jgi:hypothetical protein
MKPEPLSGLATVVTYTVNHQRWMPGLEVPYVASDKPSGKLTAKNGGLPAKKAGVADNNAWGAGNQRAFAGRLRDAFHSHAMETRDELFVVILRIPAESNTRSGRSRTPRPGKANTPERSDAGGAYFAGFFPFVKPFRSDSPLSLIRCAPSTSRSQIASATVSSPMTACQFLGSS